MEKDKDMERLTAELLGGQLFGILSTRGTERPHSVIVSFVSANHLKEIIFVTPRQTRKYEDILADGHVSLFVDNRTNTITDLQTLVGVEARGIAAPVEPDGAGVYRQLYLAKYPDMKDFIDSPSSVLMKITVARYEMIRHFQNVTFLELS